MITRLTITIPPAGLWKGSKGLFFFSLLWNGFMVVFTYAMLFASSSGKTPWPAYLFVAAFWAIGISLALSAINMGKRQTTLLVANGLLDITRVDLFGTKNTQLHLDEISAVRVGPSGMEVNERPVMELQIFRKDSKKKTGLLSECNEPELQWIAWLIRNRTGIKRDV